MDSRKLTEEARLHNFASTDQLVWQTRSAAVIAEIENMLRAKKSFIEIYEYAREQRHRIAVDLHHKPAEQFGAIRHIINQPGEFVEGNLVDYYTRGFLIKEPADPQIYTEILKIVSAQFDKLIWSDIDSPYTVGNLTFTPNEHTKFKKAFSSLNEHKTSIRFIMSTDVHTNINTIPFIIVQYCSMNQDRYIRGLSLSDLDVIHYMDKNVQGDPALFRLGIIAHELSSEVYLRRGSAAANGWILHALGNIKGIQINQLKINTIPFDIYAHIQRNKVQYAIDLAKSIKPDFKMQTQYRDDCMHEKMLARYLCIIYDEIDKQTRQNAYPRSLFSQPNMVPLQELLDELKNIASQSIPFYEALIQFQNKLNPFIGVNPHGGEQLASRLSPVLMSINKEIEAERVNYYRDRHP